MHLPQAEVDFQEASARLKDPEMEMDTLCGPLKTGWWIDIILMDYGIPQYFCWGEIPYH